MYAASSTFSFGLMATHVSLNFGNAQARAMAAHVRDAATSSVDRALETHVVEGNMGLSAIERLNFAAHMAVGGAAKLSLRTGNLIDVRNFARVFVHACMYV